jgi:DNA-binding SARP family transcriptional activator
LLLNQSSGYVLAVGPDQLDLHRFERMAEDGRKALATGDPELAARMFRAALALWRGPALADVADPFAHGERARLEELRFRAVEDRIGVMPRYAQI